MGHPKEDITFKPREGDTVTTVSGKEATVIEAKAEEVKSKLAFPEVKEGVEVTTKDASKGTVTMRTTTDVTLKLDNGEEKKVNIDDITIVKVTIEGASDLADKDWFSKSDPYVTCELKDKPKSRVKTATVLNDLNPQWNFEAAVLGYTTDDSLIFEIWDNDLGKDDYLGRCTLENAEFKKKKFTGDLELFDKKGGRFQGKLKIQAELQGAPEEEVVYEEEKRLVCCC